MMNRKEEEKRWIDQILAGRPDVFEHLVDRYQDAVFSLVRRIIKDTAEAEDITQIVFMKSYQSLRTFNNQAMFSTWISRIAYNTAISAYRKRRADMVSIDDIITGSYPAFDNQAAQDEKEVQLQQLEHALTLLPPDEQLLIHFYYTQNYSMDQISEICGLTVSNTKVKLFRIRKKLQEMMLAVTNSILN